MNQNMNRLRVVDAGAGFGTRTPNVLPPGPVEAKGKFLYVGSEKLYVRGVTYGTFRPNAAGEPLPEPGVVDRDFFEMASSGVNAVRLYTVPPHWLLDLAQEHGLRVMAGLPWEQHVAFLEERKVARRIEDSVRAGVRSVREHPALLCFSIGNEIPAPIVRWHGRRRVDVGSSSSSRGSTARSGPRVPGRSSPTSTFPPRSSSSSRSSISSASTSTSSRGRASPTISCDCTTWAASGRS
jgi:hypothetical protein